MVSMVHFASRGAARILRTGEPITRGSPNNFAVS